jgi:hypothetical protein
MRVSGRFGVRFVLGGERREAVRNPLTRPAIRLWVLSILLDLGGIAVKRFVALFLLMSGLLVAGVANAVGR